MKNKEIHKKRLRIIAFIAMAIIACILSTSKTEVEAEDVSSGTPSDPVVTEFTREEQSPGGGKIYTVTDCDTTWDCIWFGNYIQNGNEKEPIKWRVLSVNGNEAFLLSDVCLKKKPFNTVLADVGWENCSVRKWLNEDFINEAFDADEKDAIITKSITNRNYWNNGKPDADNTNDRVFLLSMAETANIAYGFPERTVESKTRLAIRTIYSRMDDKGWIDHSNDTYAKWWGRSPGYEENMTIVVSDRGNVPYSAVTTEYYIRPALYIDLSKTVWSYAGTVNSGSLLDEAERIPIEEVSIDGLEQEYVYTGDLVEPKPELYYLGGELREYIDYVIEYDDNVGPGISSMTISGIGGFKGTVNLTFQIVESEIHGYIEGKEDIEWYITGEDDDQTLHIKGTGDMFSQAVDYGNFGLIDDLEDFNKTEWFPGFGLSLIYKSDNGSSYTYNGDLNVKHIIYESGLTSIERIACGYEIQDISIPDTATRIGDFAFANYEKLESIRIPDSVTEIGKYVFLGCTNMTEATLPDNITKIGTQNFGFCSKLESVTLPEKAEQIGEGIFYECTLLKEVSLPKILETLPSNAFYNCKALESIEIPDSVTSIGSGAFCNSALKNINIPNSVISIGSSAFYECKNLESVSMSNSVEDIGMSAFAYCEKLESIDLSDKVKVIENYTFKNCAGLKEVSIPDGVTIINDQAFYFCESLSHLEIPSSVKSLGEFTFSTCSSLSSVEMSDGGVESIGFRCFINCDKLKSIRFSNTLKNIEQEAFEDCKELEEVVLPEGLTSISCGAFLNCSGMRKLSLPDTLKELKNYSEGGVFKGCNNITEFVLPQCVLYSNQRSAAGIYYIIHDLGQTGIHITLNNSVTDTYGFFSGSDKITKLTLRENVETVGGFSGCTALSDIQLNKNLKVIENNAFFGCTAIKEINLDENLKTIGSKSFYGCASLEKIDIPDGLTDVGDGAFKDCQKLNDITIPQCVTDKYKSVFDYTGEAKTTLKLSENVTYIKDETFKGCSRLKSIQIPDSVTSIGIGTFYGCTNLGQVTLPKNISRLESSLFDNCASLISVDIPDNVTEIGASAFSGCNNLKTVNLPKNLAILDSYAFNECTNLADFILPEGLETVGNYAFKKCNSLAELRIPDGTVSIGLAAFDHCDNLTNITIPNSLTSIGKNALNYCEKLTDIYYTGTKEQMNEIEGISDAIPKSITIHYESDGETKNISKANYSLAKDVYFYTGNIILPEISSITYRGKELKEGVDYSLSSTSKEIGVATTTINGIGDYTGTITIIYFIVDEDEAIIDLPSRYETEKGKTITVTAEVTTPYTSPNPEDFLWSLDTSDGKLGSASSTALENNSFSISVPVTFDKPGEYKIYAHYGGVQEETIITVYGSLRIKQPSEGKDYVFVGNKQSDKTFTMTLNDADETPKASDFKFAVKRSNDLTSTPSENLSDIDIEVQEIKRNSDRKWDITFAYKPDETGHYGLTVTYKDDIDDTELMVFDSNLLDKLELDFDKTVGNYYDQYCRKIKAEAKNLYEEVKNTEEFVKKAEILKNDSSNMMNGTSIADPSVDVYSLDLCAYEAYARHIEKVGNDNGIQFDKIDNDTAATQITQKVLKYIVSNVDYSPKEILLDSKAIIDGKEYKVKATWNILYENGSICLHVQDKSRDDRTYVYSIANQKKINSVVANYIDALKDLNEKGWKNVESQWYNDLVKLLDWDILKDIDTNLDIYTMELSEDIVHGLERHGINNVMDNLRAYHNYYKKIKELKDKLREATEVFKRESATQKDRYTSIYGINSIEFDSKDPGIGVQELYTLLKYAEKSWKEYMLEYFKTGTIKDLEPENVFGTLKNGFKNAFKCPINITVFAPDNQQVGYVGEDDIWFNDDIFIRESGDEKIIYTPKSQGYRFEVEGTDYGVVSYTIDEITNGVSSDLRINYYDIPIEEGTKVLVEIMKDTTRADNAILITSEGETFEPTIVSTSSKVTVSVNNDSDKGIVNGAGNYTVGDMVTLKAEPTDNYYFNGWYIGNAFKSFDEEYQFEVRKDTLLTANYIKKPTESEIEEILQNNHEHEWNEWETFKEATTTEEGLKKRTCYVCGYEETEVIPKTSDSTDNPDPSGGNTNQSYKINATNFPDKIFRSYVSSKFDKNKDGTLSAAEVNKVTEIIVFDKGISNLKGIEIFKNLSELSCGENKFSVLDLSKNTKLKNLFCSNGVLKSLNISKCSSLARLDCSVNQLKTLDLSNNPALVFLDCSFNEIKSLDISKNPLLLRIYRTGDLDIWPGYISLWVYEGSLYIDRTTKVTPRFIPRTNPMKTKAKVATFKYAKVRKKAQTFKISKYVKISNAKGKVTYVKVGGTKKISFNSKTKKIKIKKGLKKGKYKIKVKVKAAGNAYFKPKSKVVTFTVKIK